MRPEYAVGERKATDAVELVEAVASELGVSLEEADRLVVDFAAR